MPTQYTPNDMKVTELFKAGTEPTSTSAVYTSPADVSNLSATLNGDRIKLSWTAPETPKGLNIDYLSGLYSKTCRNVGACANTIKGRLGELKYNIYLKDQDGSLKLLHGTTSTSTEESVPQNIGNKATFVVKATYTNIDIPSSGVEAYTDISSAVKKIEAHLNGSDNMEVGEVDSFKEPGVTITEGGTTVKGDIKITYKTEDGKTVTTISDPGHYTATYTVTYKDFTKTLTRKIFKK